MNKIKKTMREGDERFDKKFPLGEPKGFKSLKHFTMWDRDEQIKKHFNQSQKDLVKSIIKEVDEMAIEEVGNSGRTVYQVIKLLQDSIK